MTPGNGLSLTDAMGPLAVALLVLLAMPVGAEAPSLEDRGLDGAVRYYSVRCDGTRRVGLEHHFKDGQFCLDAPAGRVCLSDSNAQRAAAAACDASLGDKT